MSSLVLHDADEPLDSLIVDSFPDDLLSIRTSHGGVLLLSKDSAQQLTDYLTAWLGEAK